MAKTTTNDRKRAEMQALFADLLGPKGWEQRDLVAFTGLSNISQYKQGKSMGTNELRAQLSRIPAAKSPEAIEEATNLYNLYGSKAIVAAQNDANRDYLRAEHTARETGHYAGEVKWSTEKLAKLTSANPEDGLFPFQRGNPDTQEIIAREIEEAKANIAKHSNPTELAASIERMVQYERDKQAELAAEYGERASKLAKMLKRWGKK